MKKRLIVSLTFFTAAIAVLIGMVSCNKKFDAPPYSVSSNAIANTTIMGLKNQYGTLGANVASLITDTVIISGTVIADDKSGNFFKQIVIQDNTGGIVIQLSATNQYTTYNIGRQVWIKCQGLYIGNYNGSLQIGAGAGLTTAGKPIMEGIPSTLIQNYLIAGTLVDSVKPKVVTASQLTTGLLDSLQNTLIELDNYQFANADTSKTYADPALISTTAGTFYPQTCSGNNTTLELYNSNYAYFAGLPVPKGNGALIGVYTIYGSYEEIEIRDTSDVKFYGTRCNGSSAGTPTTTISALRATYTGSNITLASGTVITGVVISDATNKNVSSGTAIIQQGNSGISVYFGGTINYNIGDSVIFDVSGATLKSYMGSLEVSTAYGSVAPTPVATGRTVTPQVLTVQQLKANLAGNLSSSLEYTLVEIDNATASGGTTFGGSGRSITDASGNMTLYTATAATFGSTTLPSTCKNWVGYTNLYNTTPEFQIRNTNDITTSSACGSSSSNTITIAALRALYTGSTTTVPSNTEITGVVISDATNKNISAGSLILQQGNSGMSVYLTGTITYNVGDSITLDVSGATLKSYNGSLEVDPTSHTQPTPLATDITITPQVMTIAQLKANLAGNLSSSVEHTLVEIDNATASGSGTTFSGNKTITDASDNMTLYTASTATFSGSTRPSGAHNWVGFANNYNTTAEFQIRNLNDIQ